MRIEVEIGLIKREYDMGVSLPVGGHVEVLPMCALEGEWVHGEVIDLLATQFTCEVEGETHFYFYTDKGTTWRQLKQE